MTPDGLRGAIGAMQALRSDLGATLMMASIDTAHGVVTILVDDDKRLQLSVNGVPVPMSEAPS